MGCKGSEVRILSARPHETTDRSEGPGRRRGSPAFSIFWPPLPLGRTPLAAHILAHDHVAASRRDGEAEAGALEDLAGPGEGRGLASDRRLRWRQPCPGRDLRP